MYLKNNCTQAIKYLWGRRKPNRVGIIIIIIFYEKSSLILGAVFVLALTSCSTEKECTCITSTNAPGVEDVETTFTIDEGKCSESNSEVISGGITVKVTCK